jgi:hypothetical protein
MAPCGDGGVPGASDGRGTGALRFAGAVIEQGLTAPTASLMTTEVVIVDLPPWHDPNVTTLAGADRISAAEQKRILDLIFGGRYLADSKFCKGTAPDIDAARAAGDFAPYVYQVATGAFTYPSAKQRLYLVGNRECGASHHWSTITLAVVDDSGVVAQANLPGGASIERIVDLDGDGRSEFLVMSGFTNQGASVRSAILERFDAGKLVEVKSFGEVYSGNCGGPSDPKTEDFVVIRATVRSGAAPEFKTEKKSRACPRHD